MVVYIITNYVLLFFRHHFSVDDDLQVILGCAAFHLHKDGRFFMFIKEGQGRTKYEKTYDRQ